MKRLIVIFALILAAELLICVPAPARAAEPVPVVYFYTEGCSECQAVETMLSSLESQGTFTIYRKYEALDKEGSKVRSALDDAYGVPAGSRGVAPTLFVGRQVLLRESAIRAGFAKAVATATPADSAYLKSLVTNAEGAPATDGKTTELFKTFGVLTVIGAGLIDGINPCAFATLVFFISYLILRSKTKRDILMVGLAFGAGVFVAYLLAGLGLYQVVSKATWFFALSRWFYLGIGLLTAVLAVVSFMDVGKAARGRTEDMSLQLPARQKQTIHRMIRETVRTDVVAITAFAVAFPVSLFEFLCTGQTYLPTIVFIYSQNILRARAVLLLAVYNLLFIAPLIAITLIAYWGVSSQRMVAWLTDNAKFTKLATALLFVVLSAWMLVRAAALFGIR